MSQNFTEYLMSYCMSVEMTTDDLLPEIYADWITTCDPELIVELAEKWHKKELDKAMTKDRTEADNFLDALKTDPKEVIKWAKSEIGEYKKLIKLLEGEKHES